MDDRFAEHRRWIVPVTKDQADMLAALAAAARPHGASRWDAPGIVAAIAEVKHLALADVMRAVANACDDRDVQTPGVIANMRSACWQDRPLRPAPIEVIPPEQRCGICGKARARCETAPRHKDDDHGFEPDFKVKRGPEVAQIVAAVNAELQPTTTPAPATPSAAEPDPRAEAARAALTTTALGGRPQRETEGK